MSGEVVVENHNFKEEVLESKVPVIADFWAEWCVPCKMVEPILEEMAKEYEGKIKIAKINVDENGEIASQFNIVSIPTLLLFKDGNIVRKQIGAVPRHIIENMIKDYI
ncbi:MAG: thioredoxin [Spirochaetes bacterium]|nr:MAG: thioredoxin [Spirochaetota bacterium]